MRFIGSKENLLDYIEFFIKERNIRGEVFCDLFAGTASVGKHFKKLGYKIISTDILYFSYVLQRVYIEQNKYPKFSILTKDLRIKPLKTTLFENEDLNAKSVIHYLDNIESLEGYIYKNYSPEGTKDQKHVRKYFTGENARKIDAIREKIEEWKQKELINEEEYFYLLGSLIEAVPFVSNISGTYGAFLKNWDKRAFKKLTLEAPIIIESKASHKVFNEDGVGLLDKIGKIDILYLDPPYNERQYAPNYHILETIAKWDNPRIKGVTGLREYNDQKSGFCNVATALKAMEEISKKKNFKHLVLSYNNEGIMPEKEILALFNRYGKTEIIEQNYQRFKSNSNGELKTKVKEKLYYMKPLDRLNKLNDLNGAEWAHFLNSVEVTHYSTNGADSFAHHLRRKNPSPKPPQLMKRFVDFFTKEGQVVLDPFMGVGGSLLACSLSGRRGIGIDISKEFIDVYEQVCAELRLEKQTAIVGDSANIDKLLDPDTTVDFILTDPPYGEMLSRKRTGERKKKNGFAEATPFTEHELDLGNMNHEDFHEALKDIIYKASKYLKVKGYIAVFIKDLQPNGKSHNMLHSIVTEKLLEIPSLTFRGYKIWYDATQKLYPFGYPHAFVANQFHQYILIFRKEK